MIGKVNPTHSQAHLQFAQANPAIKNCKRAFLFTLPFPDLKKQNLDSAKIENMMSENKAQQVTLYIKNRRDISKFKGCGSFQTSLYIDSECFEIAYFSYTEPLPFIMKKDCAN